MITKTIQVRRHSPDPAKPLWESIWSTLAHFLWQVHNTAFLLPNASKTFILNITLVTDLTKKKIKKMKNNPIFWCSKKYFFSPRVMKIHYRTLKMKLNPRDSNGK